MSQAGRWFQHPVRADCEDVSGGALVSAPLKGVARCVFTGPFAASLRRCVRRFVRSHAQHPLLSEQTVRMSHAGH
eukprot:8958812-Pyramimonas_sp.AAC.1